jgi:Nucleotidyltransferase
MSRRYPTFEEALLDLKRLLTAIEPYLGEIVLGGGWAPYFYRCYPGISSPSHPALFTFDFDVVVPPVLPVDPAGPMSSLLANGNFAPRTAIRPPVVIYQHESWQEAGKAPVYVEMLTPLRGSEVDRSGEPKYLKKVQTGLTAQCLRYLDLLLYMPIEMDVARVGELELEASLKVRVPNPATYLLQKALIHGERTGESQRKDLAYIYDVAVLWFRKVDAVSRWMDAVGGESHEWRKWVIKGRDVLLSLFSDADADGPVAVESEFAARADGAPVSARAAATVIGRFLESVFPRSSGR